MIVSNWDKERLLRSTILAGFFAAGLASTPALAQEADEPETTNQEEEQDEDQAGDSDDRIVVTGSRIARDEFSSASPIQVVDGELARDIGLIDAQAILNQTTVVQGQQTTVGLSTSAGLLSDNGPGSATASLRGLDAGRTLVLVNGRRLAPAGVRGAPSAPDLNLIPGSLINRVEVLLDGASSVYGSDAVAGVVNYILRDDFDGLELDAFMTFPEMDNGAGAQQVYSATLGLTNDRGYINVAAEYSFTEQVTRREFGSFYPRYAGGCITDYELGASGTIYENCGGSFGAGSASFSGFGFVGFDGTSSVPGFPAGWFPIGITSSILQPDDPGGQALLLFPEELDAIWQPNFERITLFTNGEYELGFLGGMTAYFEASYGQRETETRTSGQSRVRMPADYVLNPFGTSGTMYFRSFNENVTNVAQLRLTSGVRGDMEIFNGVGPLQNWTYDGYVSYSRSDGADRVTGVYDFTRFEQVLSNTRLDSGGNPVCDARTVVGETQQVICRPLNFFDPGFLLTGRFSDPEDNEYFFPDRLTNTVVEQITWNGFVSGDLFELPAGPVGAVLGVEYREDRIRTDTDAGAAAGEFFGFFGDPGSNGQRNLMEAFTEIEIPVLSGQQLAEELSFNLAARWTEESEFGANWTYRIQGQYAPIDWLRFRATYGTSFRAPNLGEQFGGRVQGFGNPQDPCRVPGVALPFVDHDNDPSTPDQRQYDPTLDPRDADLLARCRNGGGPFNFPGVDPVTLGITGLGTPTVTFLGAPTQVASGSNPNLQAETSEAISAGFVFEQPWFDRFDLRFSTTYFDITVEDEVDSLTAQTITALCYNSTGLDDPQCRFVTRDTTPGSTGEIIFVEALNQNLGSQTVEGIDYNLEFDIEVNTPWFESPFDYTAILRATQMLTQDEEQITADGTDIDDDLGEFGNPEWRVNLTNVVRYNDLSFVWQTRYIDGMIEDNADPTDPSTSGLRACNQAGDTPCIFLDNAEEYFIHDASVSYAHDTWIIRGGVSNVFNEAPPIMNNTVRGIGWDLGGRTFFANVTKQF